MDNGASSYRRFRDNGDESGLVEIIRDYKDGLILYSIGNFIFQTETVEFQPWDAYANRNMPLDTKVGAYMDDRSKNGTAGYCVQWPIWNAVMGAWTLEDGEITEVDCCYGNCVYQPNCPIAREIEELLEK